MDHLMVDIETMGNKSGCAIVSLAAAYGMLNTKIPWDFRKERCCRTLYSYAPDLIKGWKCGGIAHKSLDDCHNQINKCVAIWNHIKK